MSAKKSNQDHREYRIRGAATNRKRRKVEAKSGPKSKSGYKLTAPWVCPNPELHGIKYCEHGMDSLQQCSLCGG